MPWIVSDSGRSFDSAWKEVLFVLLDPLHFTMFTAFKHNRWQVCSLHKAGQPNTKYKASRSQRILKATGGAALKECLIPNLVALSHCFVCIQGPSLKPDRPVGG